MKIKNHFDDCPYHCNANGMQYYRTALLAEMSERENLIEVDSSMSEKEVDKVLKEVSGICITGYSDPEWIDEYLIAHAMENGKALFAICQGIQNMALYTRDDVEPVVGHQLLERKHEYVHWVNISRNSILYNIIGKMEPCWVTVTSPCFTRWGAKRELK